VSIPIHSELSAINKIFEWFSPANQIFMLFSQSIPFLYYFFPINQLLLGLWFSQSDVFMIFVRLRSSLDWHSIDEHGKNLICWKNEKPWSTKKIVRILLPPAMFHINTWDHISPLLYIILVLFSFLSFFLTSSILIYVTKYYF